MKKALLVAATSLTLVGCASQNSIGNTDPSTTFEEESSGSIYAKLEKTENGYEFTRFTLGHALSEGPWVSILNDAPIWDTTSEECLKGIAKPELKCHTADSTLFRMETSMTGGQAAQWGMLSVLTAGLWLTMPPGRVAFDEEQFKQSYNEAFEKLSSDIRYNPKNLVQEAKLNMARLKQMKDSINYNVRISNDTGFALPDPSSRGITLETAFRRTKLTEYGDSSFLYKQLDRISVAATTHENLEDIFKVTCYPGSGYSSFELDVDCGELEYNTATNKMDAQINIEVLGKKNINLYPKNLLGKDNVFEVQADGLFVTFTNNSSSYMNLKNFSFYNNGRIYTKTWSARESLPPHSEQRYRLDKLISGRNKVEYMRSAKSEDQLVDITYKIAAAYTVNGQERGVTGKKTYRKLSELTVVDY